MNLTPEEEKLWVKAWCSVSNANDYKHADTARNWADKMITALRERRAKVREVPNVVRS